MSLPAALSGLVLVLLSVSGVQGQGYWGVIYTQTQVCAVKGSTVDISCSYTYPTRTLFKKTEVLQTLWSKGGVGSPVDLMSDPDYKGRVQYLCDQTVCTLRITDLGESDSAQYKFTFRTNYEGSHTGSPGVTLSVTALQVQVITSEYTESYRRAELRCESSCQAGHQSYIWIRNGRELLRETSSSLSVSVYPADRYSCALKGFEEFPSPAVCEFLALSVLSFRLTSPNMYPDEVWLQWFRKRAAVLSGRTGVTLRRLGVKNHDSGRLLVRPHRLTSVNSIQLNFIYIAPIPNISSQGSFQSQTPSDPPGW
uniref:Ig-like domain-containing protein n=1 Tax=Fundulus heteroclitus TaxID=8078 RepID=A0A3Q2THX4_FUNHE